MQNVLNLGSRDRHCMGSSWRGLIELHGGIRPKVGDGGRLYKTSRRIA